MTFHRAFAGIASAIVLLAVVWGFLLAGSPMLQRQRRFDDRRVQDLQSVVSAVYAIVTDGRPPVGIDEPDQSLRKPLPPTLQEVAANAPYEKILINDPQSGAPYEYRIIDPKTYELCATFSLERDQPYDISWNHPAGRHCYVVDVLSSRVR